MAAPIKSFSIGCSKTINLGNYNNIRVEASVTCEVGEGEYFETVRKMALADLKDTVEAVYKSELKKGTTNE